MFDVLWGGPRCVTVWQREGVSKLVKNSVTYFMHGPHLSRADSAVAYKKKMAYKNDGYLGFRCQGVWRTEATGNDTPAVIIMCHRQRSLWRECPLLIGQITVITCLILLTAENGKTKAGRYSYSGIANRDELTPSHSDACDAPCLRLMGFRWPILFPICNIGATYSTRQFRFRASTHNGRRITKPQRERTVTESYSAYIHTYAAYNWAH